MHFIQSHTRRHRLVRHAECAAEATAVIRTIHGNEHEALDVFQQRFGFVVIRPHDLGRLGDSETANRAATIVNRNRVRKLSPRKGVSFQNVMEKLDKFERISPDMLHIPSLLQRVKVMPYLLHTASGRPDDAVVLFEIFDKEAFGGGCIYFVSAIGHWLPAAGLIQRIIHVQAESFQEFQGGYPDLGINHIDVAGYKQADLYIAERKKVWADQQSFNRCVAEHGEPDDAGQCPAGSSAYAMPEKFPPTTIKVFWFDPSRLAL